LRPRQTTEIVFASLRPPETITGAELLSGKAERG
jgi:hypothetical protein